MRKESEIEDPTYQDTIVIQMLEIWGNWFREASRLPNLGYPTSVPFIWESTGGNRRDSASYVEEYGESEALPLMIHYALKMNRTFLKVAEITYAFNRPNTSVKEKARQMRLRNFYLGSSEDSCRKKYKQLEDNLHSYIQGYITAYEINLD